MSLEDQFQALTDISLSEGTDEEGSVGSAAA